MSALLSIDEALFRFLNQKLANPVFDVLMPFLSGNPFFLPSAMAVGGWLLWRGGAKARCYVLMIAILLSLGDPLLCNSLKKYFQRPRPFVTLTDTRQPPAYKKSIPMDGAATNTQPAKPRRPSYSLPSAHSFNWGALAMITFIYFRRSWRFMVPLALAIGYSRIYNGVHYPGDVLAGLLLGAAYGFSGVVTLNAFWGWAGKKLFPLWWNRVPSLVNEPAIPTPSPAAENSEARNQQWLRLGFLAILAILAGRLLYIASDTILLSEDEAYQWLWSKHLALSYYSKPAGIAVAQWIGTSLWDDTAFGVRFLSPVVAAILGLVLLRFVTRHTDGRTAFWFVLVCAASPLLSAGAVLMTVDPLTVLFWTLAMLAAWQAITRDSTRWWLAAGLGMGASFLCKYVSPFQWASFALFFALHKQSRSQLRRPGPWLALGINLLASLPVILWNQQHDWITMTHLEERGGLEKAWQPTLKYFGEFIGAELGLLNIIFAIAVLWAIAAFVRNDFPKRNAADARRTLELFLLTQGIVVLGFYTLYTFKTRVHPNWIATCIMPLLLFAALWWHRRWQAGDRKPVRFLAAGLAIGLPLVVFGLNTDLIEKVFHKPLPGRVDPLHRLRGHDQVARIVSEHRAGLLKEGKPVFIIADHYGRAGLLNFYLPEARPLVQSEALVTVRKTEKPKNQLWFWPGYTYESRKGQNAIYVWETDEHMSAPDWLQAGFASVTDLGMFDIEYRGRNYNRIQLFACRGKN
jgi:membrane-associated phospholipid phosphatase